MIDQKRSIINIRRLPVAYWSYRGGMRLTHTLTGVAVNFDLAYARSIWRSTLVAKRWLSSVARHRQRPQGQPIYRTYCLAPVGYVKQDGHKLADGFDATLAMLDGRLDAAIRANLARQ